MGKNRRSQNSLVVRKQYAKLLGLGNESRRKLWRWCSQHPALVVNLILMVACMAFGMWVYAGKINSCGDDLSALNPKTWSSEWDYLKDLYMLAGPVGCNFLLMPWRIFVHVFQSTPDTFPWWLVVSLNLSFIVIAPFNMIFAGRAFLNFGWRKSLYLLVLLCCVWIINPAVYIITVRLPVVMFSNYTLPLYLVSIGVLLFSKASFGQRLREWFGLICCYIILAVNNSTFMLSLPLLFTILTLTKIIVHRWRFLDAVKAICLWIILSALSALFVVTAPGFQRRAPALSLATPNAGALSGNLIRVYQQTVDIGYTTLFSDRLPNSVWLHGMMLTILIIGLVVTCLAFRRTFGRDDGQNLEIRDLLGTNLLALGFLFAFQASTLSLLFTSYFPEYTKVYPAFLLASGIGITTLWIVQLSHLTTWHQLLPMLNHMYPLLLVKNIKGYLQFLVVVTALLLLTVMWVNTVPNMEAVINTYRKELWVSAIRQRFREQIGRLNLDTGQENFRLSRCPPFTWIESDWGFRNYFSWQGYPPISVVADGNGDSMSLLGNKQWTVVDCVVPPLFPLNPDSTSREVMQAVRTVTYYDIDGRGSWDSDFYVAENVNQCVLTGWYNPNVAGSSMYHETFEYNLQFGVGWAGELVRLMQAQWINGVRFSDSIVTINFVYGGQVMPQVPLQAFSQDWLERPLVRVTVKTGSGAGWLTDYSDIQLKCN